MVGILFPITDKIFIRARLNVLFNYFYLLPFHALYSIDSFIRLRTHKCLNHFGCTYENSFCAYMRRIFPSCGLLLCIVWYFQHINVPLSYVESNFIQMFFVLRWGSLSIVLKIPFSRAFVMVTVLSLVQRGSRSGLRISLIAYLFVLASVRRCNVLPFYFWISVVYWLRRLLLYFYIFLHILCMKSYNGSCMRIYLLLDLQACSCMVFP